MTNNLEVDNAPFCLEAVKDNENAVMVYFNLLGPAVATHCYNVK